MQRNDVRQELPQSPYVEPQCEVLFEMFDGSAGKVHLGRLLKGHDAGRLVALRALGQKPSGEIASATDLARSLAHPKLAKVLGTIRDGNDWYLASEYIAGVTLFELAETVESRGTRLGVSVALRIVLDALKAADDAQRLLRNTANLNGVRCIYPESIWIAEFGETFVSEVLVAPLLAPPSEEGARVSAQSADVLAAAVELVRLVYGSLAIGDTAARDVELPREVRDILARAVGPNGTGGDYTLKEFIDVLSALGKQHIANEAQVSAELERLMGTVLDRRRKKLEMLERFSSQAEQIEEDDATKFFRVAVTGEQHDTARPPALTSSEPQANQWPSVRQPSIPDDLETMVRGRASQFPVPGQAASEPAAAEAPNETISSVWREARALHEASGRSNRPNILPTKPKPRLAGPDEVTRTVAPATSTAADSARDSSNPRLGAPGMDSRGKPRRRIALYLLLAFAIAGVALVLWARHTRATDLAGAPGLSLDLDRLWRR